MTEDISEIEGAQDEVDVLDVGTLAEAPPAETKPAETKPAEPKLVASVSTHKKKQPVVVIYGPPGSGKSTSIAQTFQRHLFVTSNAQVLDPYDDWLTTEEGAASGLKPVKNVCFDRVKLSDKGAIVKTAPTYTRVKAILNDYIAACVKSPGKYTGLVFDEWTDLSFRIFSELEKDPKFASAKTGNTNKFAVYDALNALHDRLVFDVPEATKTGLVLVCHPSSPSYFDEVGPRNGQLKWPGGPKLPSGALMTKVCADASVVLQVKLIALPPDVENPDGKVERVFCTEAHPLWLRKFRSFKILPKEKLNLRDMWLRAGYPLE